MASRSRAHVLKAAFILCILLLLLLNFSNFRSKLDSNNFLSRFSTRTSDAIASGIHWSVRPNFHDERKSATNSIGNEQFVSKYSSTNATNRVFNNNNLSSMQNSTTDIDDDSKNKSEQIAENHTHFNHNNLPSIDPFVIMQNNRTDHKASNKSATMPSETSSQKSPFLLKLMTKFGLNACPLTPPSLNGPIDVNIEYESISSIESKFRNKLLSGGWYKPKECNPKDRVAIVIPYRDRENHLPIFLKNLHPLLMKQQVEYGIFVIEQITDGLFNRAALMNVGFLEALKLHQWDCFIFHDVDLIPMDDRNIYNCPDQPRHMSVAVDTMGFKLPYSGIFGGVSAMTVKQFQTVNGFSNSFWGWGGEDDDMSNRLRHVGYHIARYPVNIARYTMLTHRKEKANPKRYEKLVNGAKKFNTEGLNSLKYEVQRFERRTLYTWILVEIKQDSNS